MTLSDITRVVNNLRNECAIREQRERLGYLTALLDVMTEVKALQIRDEMRDTDEHIDRL